MPSKPIVCAHGQTSDFRILKKHDIQPTADGVILWHIVNFTEDMDRFRTILAFTQAFDTWQTALDQVPPIGRGITFKSTANYDEAHIRLMFLDPKKRDHQITRADGVVMEFNHQWPFDGNGGVLAHVPLNCEDIYFDEGEHWGDMFKWVGDDVFVPLLDTCEHEIGHALDLDHTSADDDVMFATSDGVRRKATKDTILGLEKAGWGKKKAKFMTSNHVAATLPPRDVGEDMLLAALQYFGIREVPGPGSHPTIIALIKKLFPKSTDDGAVAWCSIFMNHVAEVCGVSGTGSGMARSWLKWGRKVEWKDRRPGDVAVFWRGTPNSPSGHVALYVNDKDVEGTYLRVLGGNQTDAVTIAAYNNNRLLELRRYE